MVQRFIVRGHGVGFVGLGCRVKGLGYSCNVRALLLGCRVKGLGHCYKKPWGASSQKPLHI